MSRIRSIGILYHDFLRSFFGIAIVIYVQLIITIYNKKNEKKLLKLFLQKGKIDGAVPGLWLQVQARCGQKDPRKQTVRGL